MTSTAPTTPIPDAPAAQVATPAAQAPAAAPASTPAARRPFFARPAVRWGGAVLIALLLVGGGFAGGFAAGAASGIFGSSSTMRGPGGSGFPGDGQMPDGQMPGDGQMPQRLGSGSDSGTGTGNGTGSGTSGGTDSGTGS